jgi:hypothetical protein
MLRGYFISGKAILGSRERGSDFDDSTILGIGPLFVAAQRIKA